MVVCGCGSVKVSMAKGEVVLGKSLERRACCCAGGCSHVKSYFSKEDTCSQHS